MKNQFPVLQTDDKPHFQRGGLFIFPQPPENRGNYSFNTTKKIIIWWFCPILSQEKNER